ncbi:UNKNOWN [Stylonychia lemnae]|uniref:Uncharacterized protein n=1 Tax=Stylonychia lemnae TaxID=5949 RepID=A0A078B1I0_STYLE|nr:UNKNOWN [Stylonychia lemnae]|eukprot:CDW88166.1 UNKNOWN [Stylonychia lemnae]
MPLQNIEMYPFENKQYTLPDVIDNQLDEYDSEYIKGEEFRFVKLVGRTFIFDPLVDHVGSYTIQIKLTDKNYDQKYKTFGFKVTVHPPKGSILSAIKQWQSNSSELLTAKIIKINQTGQINQLLITIMTSSKLKLSFHNLKMKNLSDFIQHHYTVISCQFN